jgi:hypothetical protein
MSIQIASLCVEIICRDSGRHAIAGKCSAHARQEKLRDRQLTVGLDLGDRLRFTRRRFLGRLLSRARTAEFHIATVLNRISFQKLANSVNKAILRALVRLRLDVLHSNSRISTDPGFIRTAYQHARLRVHYRTMSRTWQHPSSTSW